VLSLLLTQFRQRYPQGSLTSALLTIHDGLYVVQVCAGADGTTLASGLGANTTLEMAEDMATTRALERLGLPAAEPASPILPSSAPSVAPSVAPSINIDDFASDSPSPEGLTSPPSKALPSLKGSGPAIPRHASPAPVSPPLALVQPEPEPAIADSILDLSPALATPPPKAAPQPQEPLPETFDFDEPADELVGLGTGPVASVDLSDIIAQTDVELQRLGWGVNQGREFLEKTYGKRSRHDLTDDELLEFLLFLETQSPPGSL